MAATVVKFGPAAKRIKSQQQRIREEVAPLVEKMERIRVLSPGHIRTLEMLVDHIRNSMQGNGRHP